MKLRRMLFVTAALVGASALAQPSAPPAGKAKGAAAATQGGAGGVARSADDRRPKEGVAPTIPDVAARSPSAPPAHVLQRLRENGASPVAIGVHEQLADDPPLSPR